MEYSLPFIGIGLPWIFDYILILVGLYSVYRVGYIGYLLVAAQYRKTDLSCYGPGSWAVVTGSTDGIGKAFVEALASRGFNIYSMSRNPEKLRHVADEITGKYKVEVFSRAWDFNNSVNLKALVEIVEADLKDKDVSILVNNVGTGYSGLLHSKSASQVKEGLCVNCLPITYMSRLLLPKLSTRLHKSAVINLSSLGSLAPLKGLAVYSASKKFDTTLTESLAENGAYSNVTFMNYRPGYVYTALAASSVKQEKAMAKITPKESAESALRDLGLDISWGGHLKHKIAAAVGQSIPESYLVEASYKDLKLD